MFMQRDGETMKSIAGLRWLVVTLLVLGFVCPRQALAQVPARFYWKSLTGATGVPLILESISGNSNPFDPSRMVMAGANFTGTIALAGYARTFSLFDRAGMVALIEPMGRLSGEVTVGGNSFSQASNGFGDPTLELNVNLLGPPAQKSIPDALRYTPGFSVDVLADLAFPIGEYDNTQPLNLSQNRWYGRVGAPILWQLGPWVPGRRTTLELLPAVWLFGTNSDYVGQTMKTDPMFQLDSHLSRDFTDRFWGAFDVACYKGGKASVNGVEGEPLNNVGYGFTLGNQINENLALTVGYKSTVNDHGAEDLRMDVFMVTLMTGWHPIIEGERRLKGGE